MGCHGFCPPKIMGGLDNFFPFYLGGTLQVFHDFGGTLPDGGSLDMMGEYQYLDLKNISLLYLLLQACFITS